MPEWDDYRLQIESGLKESLVQRAMLNEYMPPPSLELQLRKVQMWRLTSGQK